MVDNKDRNYFAASFEFFQRSLRAAGPAASASYTLIGAVILLGGLGYLIDHWLESAPWFLIGGLLLGVVVGLYELAKVAFRK